MKKAKKIVALLLCALLLIGASIAGTVAYLTSTPDPVTNTFTVGKVEIDLNEVDSDNDGNTKNNTYNGVVPGIPYEKEPYITVKAKSADCYVRAKVTVSIPNWNIDGKDTGTFDKFVENFAARYILSDNIAYGFNTTSWDVSTPAGTINNTEKTITYYLTYKNGATNDVVKSEQNIDKDLPSLFHGIQIPSAFTSDTLPYLEGMTIKVEAHAIQADGFANATAAWTEFDNQNS